MAYNVLIVSEQDAVREALSAQCEATSDFVVESLAGYPAVFPSTNPVVLFYSDATSPLPAGWDDTAFQTPVVGVVDGEGVPEPDDLFALPLRIGDVLVRIRQKYEARERIGNRVFTIGIYHFQPVSRTLWREGEDDKIRLTEKESAMLLYLLKAEGEPVGRDMLLQHVWGYHSDAATHTLETHIYRLRQKIDPDGRYAPLLVTDVAGYRLNS